MINKQKKKVSTNRRKERIRYKLQANSDRPRLVFNRTNRFLIAQVIDDAKGATVAFAISSEKDFPEKGTNRKSKASAVQLGKIIAQRAIAKGIKEVMLDRSGLLYHGRVAAFADSAREGGLQF
ncbi:MAG: 50S ribosomal protein L18 [Leptospira sp.]|nr:50S ribosomal protein L18 [Leptospira sp.]